MKISIKRQIISFFLKFLLLVFKREYPLLMLLLYFVMQVYLYIYCLKALGRMPQYFKENIVLSFVCCNGSNDIFAMFIKNHVRKCLSENWKFLNPIHIASVFNNNEILQELLQVGADVDQKLLMKITGLH